MSEQWALAVLQCQSHRKEAKVWSTRPGFFEGIKESDVLPVHQACALRPPPEMIDALWQAYPNGFEKKESAYKRIAIHIACRSGASTDTIKRILKHQVEGAAVEDALGRLPLHYAISNGAVDEVIDALLLACRSGARAYDRRGWLPIHVACSVGASTHVITELLKAYPQSIALETNKGSSPLKCCDMSNSPNKGEVVAMLKKAKAEWDKEQRVAKRPNRDSVRIVV